MTFVISLGIFDDKILSFFLILEDLWLKMIKDGYLNSIYIFLFLIYILTTSWLIVQK